MKSSRHPLYVQAKTLRKQGLSYSAIGQHLGLNRGKIWIILNRVRHNENSRESKARYVARNYKALCDV